jgi:serine phosphatase RsbU (regulator of sigma subunit)
VAGDWFDYIALPDGGVGVVVADVAGKGMAAALLMSSTRGILRLSAERSTAAVLESLNQILLRDFPRSRFVTLAYVVLDVREMTARIALAGHPPPVLITERPHLLGHDGSLPLGMRETKYAEQRVALAPGDRIVLYSDGVIEAEGANGQEYGFAGIERHFGNGDASPQSLLEDVRQFTGGAALEDDATVVTIDAANV